MKKNTLETRLGLFFALAFLAGIVILEMAGGIDWFRGGYHINTSFANIRELKPGDPVKMAGVQIGKVETITLADQKVRVTMKVNRDAKVLTDSRAALKSPSLLGQQNFVEIGFGSTGAPAVEGATLASDELPDPYALMQKLDQVAAGVENITKSFSGDAINNLLGPLTDFIKQNNQSFSAIITNAQNITAQVAAGKGTVGKLIYDDSLYNNTLATVTNLQETAANIQQAVNQAKALLAGIQAGEGTAGKLVRDEKLYNETTVAMTNLREILQKMNDGKGTFGALINDPTILKNAQVSLQKIDKAADGLEDTGPLTILGAAVNKLF